jgi:tight adherence protein B
MPVDVILSCVLIGAAIALLAWSADEFVVRALDFVAADFRLQLRRLRINTTYVRSLLAVWWGNVVACYLVLWLVFDLPVLGLLVAALLVAAPWWLVRRWAWRRKLLIEDQMADAMVSLSSAIRAGLSLAQSLDILARQSPHPICQEFQQLVGEYQLGKPMERCLEEARERLHSENFALFAAAMQASRESGGKLNETVERIAYSVREMQRLERKLIAETAQARTSALYMALVPFAILALYYFILDPVNTEKLFTTVVGQLFLCASLVLNVAAYFWARKILNPDI